MTFSALGLLLMILTNFGLYQILGRSTLLRPFRKRLPEKWRELVECPLCLGTWLGVVWASLYSVSLIGGGGGGIAFLALYVPIFGATSAGTTLMLSSLVDWLDAQGRLAESALQPPDDSEGDVS